jgi:hypothetical protein
MLFEYKYKNDYEFRQNFDEEVERQKNIKISEKELTL